MAVSTNVSDGPTPPNSTFSASSGGREEAQESLHGWRKRKRDSDYARHEDVSRKREESIASIVEQPRTRAIVEYRLKHIVPPPLIYPKSLYVGHELGLLRSSENELLEKITKDSVTEENESETFLEVELNQYSMYRPHASRSHKDGLEVREAALSNSLVCLQDINEPNVQHFLFDGTVHFEGRHYRLEKIPFDLLSIGGLEDLQSPTVGEDIWIQSRGGNASGVWYRLGTSAPEYRRYDDNFRWMADLAKHVIDFLVSKPNARLTDFQRQFCYWLGEAYKETETVKKWLSCYGDSDFRRLIANQATFLYCQATQVNSVHGKAPLWSEICSHKLDCIPLQVGYNISHRPEMFFMQGGENGVHYRKTTVTPYTYRCFRHLHWGKMLYSQPFTDRSHAEIAHDGEIAERDGSISIRRVDHERMDARLSPTRSETIAIGDVVAVAPDTLSTWKHQGLEWYAYVQDTQMMEKGQKLSLIWLYKPSDTACMKMKYPHDHELFLSDHCNCGDHPIYSDEIIRKPKVAFYGSPERTEEDFFCRQRYCEADSAWTTLVRSDFTCICRRSEFPTSYTPGQTILWKSQSYQRRLLEPAVVMGHDKHDANLVTIRILLRRRRDFGIDEAAANELVYTQRFEIVKVKQIKSACHLRFFHSKQRDECKILPPYNRDGTGNYWYMSSVQTEEGSKDLPPNWQPDFTQGWDPSNESLQEPLKGFDIFCGGGNFARGMEEAGAVKCRWAVDYFSEAIHSYHANLSATADVKFFHGSVNDYLSKAMSGNFESGMIARPGEADIIIAGSPCQGFSNMNSNKGSIKGLINESMVASVVAFVDFYRPKYAILENVKGMAAGGEQNNVLSAVLCALVGLGYQTRTFALDAWSFGTPESRTRIFISCAAPGQPPMPEPVVTHRHPDGTTGGSLGRTANGLSTGNRYEVPAAFDFITAQEATSDLPRVDPGLTSIALPDHREPINMSVLDRNRISSIPRYPGGSGFLAAHARDLMPAPQVEAFQWNKRLRAGKNSKSWARFRRDRQFPTILTRLNPGDGINGTSLHWEDHRLLTVLEARRAQGFLDRDVIVGRAGEQWKIVGNSVARPVALALGLALREAWLQHSETRLDHEHAGVERETSPLGTFCNDIVAKASDSVDGGALPQTQNHKIDIEATLSRHLQKLQNLWTSAVA